MKRRVLAAVLCLLLTLTMFPTLSFAKDSMYGDSYDHIDVKVDGEYTFSVDGKDVKLNGTLDKNSIIVKIGEKVYAFEDYDVKTNTEAGVKEYEIKLSGTNKINPNNSISWISGTYKMDNVYVSARMLFQEADVPDSLKSILQKDSVSGKYYVDIKDCKYSGVNECTGGKGMRSEGKTGTPTGLDLYIAAEGLEMYITKGKLAIKKVVADEDGEVIDDANAGFEYTITDSNGTNVKFLDSNVSEADSASETVTVYGGETVTLEGLDAGTYRITEIQKDGYIINSIGGVSTNDYSVDYVVKEKADEDIPVAEFTNTRLTEKAGVSISKEAAGLEEDAVYPDPEVSIYSADSFDEYGILKAEADPVWSGTLDANGDTYYLKSLLPEGKYVITESGYAVDGYDCAAKLSVNEGDADDSLTFEVGSGDIGKTVNLTLSNTYTVTEEPGEEYPPAEDNTDWDVSRSKTATNLDSNYESEVTLSLPSAEEELVSDIVFVLDKSSCNEQTSASAADLLTQLLDAVNSNEAVINVGVISFRDKAVVQRELSELKGTDDVENIREAIEIKPEGSGTNIQAGLEAAEKMLADSDTPENRKYLILVSDGLTRLFTAEDGTVKAVYNEMIIDSTKSVWSSPTGWSLAYGYADGYYGVPGGSWDAYWSAVKEKVENDGDTYASDYAKYGTTTSGDGIPGSYISWEDRSKHALCIDRAIYEAYTKYQVLAGKYNCCAVYGGADNDTIWNELGITFMSELNGGKALKFSDIRNDILYLVDAGSYVTDYIGDAEGDYNFVFVNDPSKLTLRVGETEYKAEQISENYYGFKPVEGNNDTAERSYAYTLSYFPDDEQNEEHFIWEINEAVTNFAPVQLTYTVKLTNPKTAAGTYGQYDRDGSLGYDGLYTNNSAVLYPVDSSGNRGEEQVFNKPTVSYTVEKKSSGNSSNKPVLNKDDHFAYIIGYPDGNVRPDGNITRAEVATIFFRMLTDESRADCWAQTNSYSDVKSGAWYNNAVSTLSNAGIITGYEDGLFKPNAPITRAEFAAIAARFSDVEYSEENSFSDVDSEYWAAKYIALAEHLGWINGYPDGTFKPGKEITRAEAMKLVNEVLDRTPDKDNMLSEMIIWPDNPEDEWYYEAVQEATNSHEYERKTENDAEKWTKLLKVRDWAELEKEWSEANSSENPGNVIK